MPISYDAGTNKITCEFIAGDPKGDAFSNGYNLHDIYLAAIAGGWDFDEVVHGEYKHYYSGCKIFIIGSDTYFIDSLFTLGFSIENTAVVNISEANVILGTDRSFKHYLPCLIFKTYTQYINTWFNASGGGIKRFYYTTIKNFRIGAMSGTSEEKLQLNYCNISSTTNVPLDYIIINDCIFSGDKSSSGILTPLYLGIISSNIETSNIKLINSASAYHYSCAGVLTYRNIDTPTIRVTMNFSNAIINYVDSSNPGLSISTHASYVECNCVINRKTTLTAYINVEGFNIKIYDKNDTILINEDVVGDTYEEEITWYTTTIYSPPSSASYTVDVIDFSPLKVVITKPGYQDLIIPDNTVVEKMPTIIRGELVRPELLISAVTITDCTTIGASDGQLEITAEGGDGSYTYSINGVDYQASDTFSGLSAGDYTVYVKDGEDTVANFEVTIDEPVYKNVYVDRRISGTITGKTISGSVTTKRYISGTVTTQKMISGTVK